MGCQSWQILWYLNFINLECIKVCRNLRLRAKLPGSLQYTAEAECLMRWAIVFWQKRKTTFSTLSLVSRRVGPSPPEKKHGTRLDSSWVQDSPCWLSLLWGPGMGCPHHQAGCPQLPAEWPGQSSLYQVPSASCTSSAAPRTRSKYWLCDVLGLTFLKAQGES